MQPEFIKLTQDCSIFHDKIELNRWRLFLDGDINAPEVYREHINVLQLSEEKDCVELHISTCGGRLDTTVQYVQAIRECQAPTIAFIGSECHSAGSFIALNCTDIVVNPYSTMLVHTSQGFAGGSPTEITRQASLESARMEKLIRDTYMGFLTEKEIKDVLENYQLWIGSEEIIQRWQNKQAYLAKLTAPKPKRTPRKPKTEGV